MDASVIGAGSVNITQSRNRKQVWVVVQFKLYHYPSLRVFDPEVYHTRPHPIPFWCQHRNVSRAALP
jgi:hypothetical protein